MSIIASISPISILQPTLYEDACSSFHLFPELPVELRVRIWEAALKPRIVRWSRIPGDLNSFSSPPRSLPLMLVSREAREAAFLYGDYRNLTGDQNPVYFSPKLDYFWVGSGWMSLEMLNGTLPKDPIQELLPKLGEVQNLMIHPNWSGRRRRPAIEFEKVPSLRQILIAADEKSIGYHGKVMLESVKGVKAYYAALEEEGPAMRTPHIAVGCLGWVGEERRKLQHGERDDRQLIKIFEAQSEINSHMRLLREEEWQFTCNNFTRPAIVHKLRFVREKGDSGSGD